MERVGRGPLGEVFRGHWHGQVAVKRFCLEGTTSERDLKKFKEEVCGSTYILACRALCVTSSF